MSFVYGSCDFFSSVPGCRSVIPGSCCAVEAFPSVVKFHDLNGGNVSYDASLVLSNVVGPVEHFCLYTNLSVGFVELSFMFGVSRCVIQMCGVEERKLFCRFNKACGKAEIFGNRFNIFNGLCLYLDLLNEKIDLCENGTQFRVSFGPFINFGCNKKRSIASMMHKSDPLSLMPTFHRLGCFCKCDDQLAISHILNDKVAFRSLLRRHMDQYAVPFWKDEYFSAIPQIVNGNGSPIQIFSALSFTMEKSIVSWNDCYNRLSVLDGSFALFDRGCIYNYSFAGCMMSVVWSGRRPKTVLIDTGVDSLNIVLVLSAGVKSFRVCVDKSNMYKCMYSESMPLSLSANSKYRIDNFTF